MLFRKRADKGGLQDDSMVAAKRRGCPLESGGKGGRNKSSASNRGRASARFYSRTLNSIAIGFSWLPGSTLSTSLPLPPISFCPLLPHPARPPPPLSLSVLLLDHLYRGAPRWFLTRRNLITGDTIKYPGDEGDPLLECRHHYELWQGAVGWQDTTRIVPRAVMGTFKDCTWERYISECARKRAGVLVETVLYRTVRHRCETTVWNTSQMHDNFIFKSLVHRMKNNNRFYLLFYKWNNFTDKHTVTPWTKKLFTNIIL